MLYHYLNHYNLFGSGYRSSAMSIIDDYLRMLKPQAVLFMLFLICSFCIFMFSLLVLIQNKQLLVSIARLLKIKFLYQRKAIVFGLIILILNCCQNCLFQCQSIFLTLSTKCNGNHMWVVQQHAFFRSKNHVEGLYSISINTQILHINVKKVIIKILTIFLPSFAKQEHRYITHIILITFYFQIKFPFHA